MNLFKKIRELLIIAIFFAISTLFYDCRHGCPMDFGYQKNLEEYAIKKVQDPINQSNLLLGGPEKDLSQNQCIDYGVEVLK